MLKLNKSTIAFFVLVASVGVSIAQADKHLNTKAEKVKKETVEAVDAAGAYADEKKEEFAARMKRNLDELDREIEGLKKESHSKSAEVREETKKKVQLLQTKRDELRERIQNIEKSTDRAWKKMKAGFEKAWGEVDRAFSEAKSELSSKK